jgi:plasmid maintenance system antidote protein VapI
MKTNTVQILDRVASTLGNVSDYKAAQELGVTRQAVSNWRNDKNYMNDAPAIRAAEILGEKPETILALIAADRSDDPATKRIWTNLAKQLQRTAAATAIATLGFTMFPSDAARSAETSDFAQSVYYVK